jgi:hypothetical protein
MGGRAIFEAEAACLTEVFALVCEAEFFAFLAAAFAFAAFCFAAKAAFSGFVSDLLALPLRSAEFLALLAAVVVVRLGVFALRGADFFADFLRDAMAVLLQLSIPPRLAPRLSEAQPTISYGW